MVSEKQKPKQSHFFLVNLLPKENYLEGKKKRFPKGLVLLLAISFFLVNISAAKARSKPMEIESAITQEKAGLLARVWGWFKALPGKFKAKVLEVAKSTKQLGKDDPRRVIHSLKVGLALTLVSLLYYWRPLYGGIGIAGMWAVLTVVVVFEFTVGKSKNLTS